MRISFGTLALALQLKILRSISTQVDARGGLVRREGKSILERGLRDDSLVQAEHEELADSSQETDLVAISDIVARNDSVATNGGVATNATVLTNGPNGTNVTVAMSDNSTTLFTTTPVPPETTTTMVPTTTCNVDFPLGIQHTNTCKNITHHRLIFDEGMCERAAELAGARKENHIFHLPAIYEELHPQGCFAWHCSHDAKNDSMNSSEPQTEICYYYNNKGNAPKNPHGFPVCYRAAFLNGTADTNGGCDKDYEVVMDETTCEEAAECLGYEKEREFRIGEGNWSKHDEYPKGCFIRKDTGGFQYNDISTMNGSEPKNPQIGGGIPVCNVSAVVHWPQGGSENDYHEPTALNNSNFREVH
mmetsp:Transcript_85263/g.151012  ORF Transcript_85263/g.151012 Transcript_85263/m.151012 type:complete len:361 (+) Transcript_85263:74-1156(+)